jgi:hypothetical protein
VTPQLILDSGGLMMITATVPAAGATAIKLISGSTVLATAHKPNPAPQVRLVLPRKGLKVTRRILTIRWRGRVAHGAPLTATVQYLASTRAGWQTLASLDRTSSFAAPLAAFGGARKVRVRVLINDGFSTAAATSQRLKLPRG